MSAADRSVAVANNRLTSAVNSRLWPAVASYVLFLALSMVLNRTALPYDEQFARVVYLMWSASTITSRLISLLWQLTPVMCNVGLAFALLGVLFPAAALPRPVAYLVRMSYRHAVTLPLFFFMMANLSRLTANLVYALTAYVHWDFTPWLGRLETSAILGLQHGLYSPWLSWLCYYLYSSIWSAPLLLSGIFFIATDRPKPLNKLIVGYFLVSLLAVPFFVLFPVFDPWTTNPLYLNPGAWHSDILYLYPHSNLFLLRFTNSQQLKWSTGSCLPSLHVAIPLMVFWVLRKEGFPRLAAGYLILSILTGFAVVYLGRHWVIDIVAAVPFSYGVGRLCEKSTTNFALS